MKNVKVLFVCTHNSARSQMAEGLANALFPNVKAFSAGTEKTRVHPLAIEVMKEIGIDISHHHSKTVDLFYDHEIDLVITVCDSAYESCPNFPYANKKVHAGCPDPSSVKGTEKIRLQAFRDVRDQISAWLQSNLPALIETIPEKAF